MELFLEKIIFHKDNLVISDVKFHLESWNKKVKRGYIVSMVMFITWHPLVGKGFFS